MFREVLRAHLTLIVMSLLWKECECDGHEPIQTHMIGPARRNITTIQNQRVQIVCIAQGFPTPTITWKRKDGQNLRGRVTNDDAEGEGYEVTSTLTISQAQTRDDGVYICSATNPSTAKPIQQEVTLVVQVPTTMITLARRTVTTVQNQHVQITCTARGVPRPTITWKRKENRRRLTGGVTARIARNGDVTSTITIYRVQRANAGVYICSATNTVTTRPVEQEVILVVQVPTTITTPAQRTVTTIQNRRVRITCTARGVPRPTLTWKRKGYRQTLTRGVTSGLTRNGDASSTVTIDRPRRVNAGVYICSATNNVTSRPAEQEVTLVVQVSTQITTRPHTVTAIQNQRVQIQCTAQGIPRPTITWKRKDGQRLRGRVTIRMTSYGDVTSTITIYRAQTRDAGDYICAATNKVTTRPVEQEVTLFVQALPGKPSTPEITDLSSNHAWIKWKTQTSGNETLISHIITFKEDNSQKHRLVVNVTRYKADKTFSALLRDLRPFTLYEVWVQAVSTLGIGPSSASANFTTYMPTRMITRAHGTVIDVQNQHIKISCTARGFPRPMITWKRKDGQRVRGRVTIINIRNDEITSTIKISQAQTRDAGIYICTATNIATSRPIEQEVTLNVARGLVPALEKIQGAKELKWKQILLQPLLVFFGIFVAVVVNLTTE